MRYVFASICVIGGCALLWLGLDGWGWLFLFAFLAAC